MSLLQPATYVARNEKFETVPEESLNGEEEEEENNNNNHNNHINDNQNSSNVNNASNSTTDDEEMAVDTTSHGSSGSQYLQEVLGDVLADALSKVAKERPADPVQYVADYLHAMPRHNGHNGQQQQQTGNSGQNARKHRSPTPTPSPSPEPETDDFYDDSEEADHHHLQNGHSTRPVTPGEKREHESRRKSPGPSERSRRTAQSEPPPSVGSFSVSNPGTSSSNGSNYNNHHHHNNNYDNDSDSNPMKRLSKFRERTQSLDRKGTERSKRKSTRKPTTFSKHLPAVAMAKDDYRLKRGLLPPMKQSPKSSAEGEPRVSKPGGPTYSRYSYADSRYSNAKAKPRQLAPLDDSTFDMEKHKRRNRKLTEMSNRATLYNR